MFDQASLYSIVKILSWHYSLPSISVILISDSGYKGQILYSNFPNIMHVANESACVIKEVCSVNMDA